MTGWTITKYLLAVAGVSLLLLGDARGQRWIGYGGLLLIVAAFLLRFLQRRIDAHRKESVTAD